MRGTIRALSHQRRLGAPGVLRKGEASDDLLGFSLYDIDKERERSEHGDSESDQGEH